jgi:hypothetical protein
MFGTVRRVWRGALQARMCASGPINSPGWALEIAGDAPGRQNEWRMPMLTADQPLVGAIWLAMAPGPLRILTIEYAA